MSNLSDFRLLLQANGYAPVPIKRGEKYPPMNGWPHLVDATADDIRKWDARYPDAPGTGIILGKVGMLDADIYDAAAAEAVRELARGWLQDVGKVLIRTGQPPKCGLLFRTETPFAKKRYEYQAGHALELLGVGQQAVIDAIHPKTGKPYEFEHGITPTEIPANELPLLSEARATELLDFLDEVLRTQFDFVRLETAAPKANGHDTTAGTYDREALCQPGSRKLDIEAAFAAMPPTGAGANEYQPVIIRAALLAGWTLRAIRKEVPERTVAKAADAGLPWTIEDELPDVERRIFSCLQRLYREDPNPGGIPDWLPEELHEGGSKMLAERSRFGVCVSRVASHASKERTASGSQPRASGAPAAGPQPVFTSPPKKKISAIPFRAFDESQLPPRAFLYGMHYQRGQCTCSVGQDGAGKSTVGIAEAIALATGRNILGEEPAERCRVWLHNADDDSKEVNRRIAACCRLHNVPMTELEGWLFVTGKDDFSIRVATGNGHLTVDHAAVASISETIVENEIDVVLFDPLVTMHAVGENDNVRMSEVIHIFGDIAAKCSCAIDLCHHTRKPSNQNSDGEKEFNSDDSRGAGAIRAAVRASRVFNRMSKAEAERAGLQEEDRVFYIRIDRGKANYLPPAIKGNWFQLKSVELLNGENVGAIASWQFPGQETAQSAAKTASDSAAEHVFLEILKRFNTTGRSASERKGANYAPTLFADEKEAKAAKLNRLQLKAAMVRLLDGGRIRPHDERMGTGAGRYRSHTLVPT